MRHATAPLHLEWLKEQGQAMIDTLVEELDPPEAIIEASYLGYFAGWTRAFDLALATLQRSIERVEAEK